MAKKKTITPEPAAEDSVDTSTDVVLLGVTDTRIAELRKEFDGLKISDEDSYKMVSVAISTLSGLRTSVEARRKELKAPLIERGKLLDAEAKRVTAKLREIEDPLVAERSRVIAEREREKREREAAEQKRMQAIRDKIEAIKQLAIAHTGDTVATVNARIEQAEEIELEAFDYAEFSGLAMEAMRNTITTLREHLLAVTKQQQEREELDRLRAEQKKRDEEIAAREAELKAREEKISAAEREQQEREREALRQKQIDAEREQAAKAERERIADEQAKAAQAQAEAEERERKNQARREARKPDTTKLLDWLIRVESELVNGPALRDDLMKAAHAECQTKISHAILQARALVMKTQVSDEAA